jgi:anaerobic selenocysteine-containing dehydrogenase
MACMRAAAEGKVKGAICLGGNLFGSNPDAHFAHKALGNLDFVTYINTTLNTGHAWGLAKETLVLPCLARDEEPQPTTQESMFNYVRLSAGGPQRIPQAKSEHEILTTLGHRVLGDDGPVNWTDLKRHTSVREIIAKVIPGYEAIEKIDVTKREFQIEGRTFHTPVFPTPSGKAQFVSLDEPWKRQAAASVPPAAGEGVGVLRMMTIRSEGQFNTVVYEEQDIYRGQDRRDIILMHVDDIERFGLSIDDKVTVRSSVGEMHGIIVRDFDIRAGNCAMYLPEANVLVPHEVDPQSKTPAFKSIWLTVTPEKSSNAATHGLVSLDLAVSHDPRGGAPAKSVNTAVR